MENNNTKDVAYLGCYVSETISEDMINIISRNATDCPFWQWFEVGDTMLFDCSGTRYGFKIKELKSK